MAFETSNSSWWAQIHIWTKGYQSDLIQLGKGRGPSDIISWDWGKSLNGVGTLNLDVVPNKYLHLEKHIRPNNPVAFWVDDGMGGEPQLLSAYVDRVARTWQYDPDGKLQTVIRISCRDAQKIFEKQSITYYAQLKAIQETTILARTINILARRGFNLSFAEKSTRGAVGVRNKLTAPEYIWAFILGYMGKQTTDSNFWLPGPPTSPGKTTSFLETMDFFNFVSHPKHFKYGKYLYVDRTLGTSPNLWVLIRRYAHLLMNECFIDTRPASEANTFKDYDRIAAQASSQLNTDPLAALNTLLSTPDKSYASAASDPSIRRVYKELDNTKTYFADENSKHKWAPRLIMRPRPYLLSDMRKLPRHQVKSSQVVGGDLGFSAHEVKNYFRIAPSVVGSPLDMIPLGKLRWAVVNPDSIAVNGWERYETTSDYCWDAFDTTTHLGSEKLVVSLLQVCKEQTERIALQHYRNDKLLSGTLRMARLMPEMRVGNAVEYRDVESNSQILFYLEGVNHTGVADGRSTTSLRLVRGLPLSVVNQTEDALGIVKANTGVLNYVKLGQRRVGR